jgi:hypothetical protein
MSTFRQELQFYSDQYGLSLGLVEEIAMKGIELMQTNAVPRDPAPVLSAPLPDRIAVPIDDNLCHLTNEQIEGNDRQLSPACEAMGWHVTQACSCNVDVPKDCDRCHDPCEVGQ